MSTASEIKEKFLKAKRSLFHKLYSNLNERQREAVFTVNGPLLVLAGAGTGKTTVLVNRIANIIKFGDAYFSERVPDGMSEEEIKRLEEASELSPEEISQILSEYITEPCPPWAILCITFTNKAANEMKERLGVILGEEYAKDIWAGTFHSVCAKLLRRFGQSIGYSPDFTIYDQDDAKRLVVTCMKELNIDEKSLSAKTVLNQISNQKNNLTSPEEYAKEVGSDFRYSQISRIYSLYQKKLRDASALDFDDIIMQTVILLEDDDEARGYCQRRFKYVSVDEFQDTNKAQLKLVELLSGYHRNVMVVGDDDQSIYRFRGATIENILNFDREYSDAKVIRLEENYRSTSVILDAANGVIKNNEGRHSKELFTSREGGDKIVLKRCENQNDEAKYIINTIMDAVISGKRKYSDFAVLYRINAQSNNLEQMFARSGIPHRVIGGQRFYERKEIKDIMAYLAVINNPSDDLRLKRIINEPKRKIGDKTVSDIEYLATLYGVSMFEIINESEKYPQICKNAPKLKEFAGLINTLREASASEPLHALFEKTIEMSGYRRMLIDGGEAEADRLKNVEELITNAIEFEKTHEEDGADLRTFLEEIALITDIDGYDDESNAVVLMTIHSAKGLEFPVVFIPGAEEGLFPGTQTLAYPEEIEEERRLAYVAITRAKDRLFCIHVRERLMYGKTQYNQLSRFIKEIPEKLVEKEEAREREAFRPTSPYRKAASTMSSEFFSKPAVKSNVRSGSFERFKAGERVVHAAFGEGTVMSAREMGSDLLYEIMFDDVGTKKLMATFAKLKRI